MTKTHLSILFIPPISNCLTSLAYEEERQKTSISTGVVCALDATNAAHSCTFHNVF